MFSLPTDAQNLPDSIQYVIKHWELQGVFWLMEDPQFFTNHADLCASTFLHLLKEDDTVSHLFVEDFFKACESEDIQDAIYRATDISYTGQKRILLHPDPWVHYELVRRPCVLPEIIQEILDTPALLGNELSQGLALYRGSHNRADAEWVAEVLHRVVACAQAQYTTRSSMMIYLNAVNHPQSDAHILRICWQYYEKIYGPEIRQGTTPLAECYHGMRFLVGFAKHRSLPIDLLSPLANTLEIFTYPYNTIEKQQGYNTHQQDRLQARLAILQHPEHPISILDAWVCDPSWEIRQAVAKSPKAQEIHLSILAEDTYEYVRRAVSQHRNTPKTVLQRFLRDPDEQVKQNARVVLGYPNPA